MLRPRPRHVALALRLTAALPLLTSGAVAGDWCKVGDDGLRAISGMALLSHGSGQTEFLVVHDNKKPNEPRLGVVVMADDRSRYYPLHWPAGGNAPIDLEAVASVPGHPGRFLSLTSKGDLALLSVAKGAVAELARSELPGRPDRANFEGIGVQQLGGELIAVWGHRGEGEGPGQLYWGRLDPNPESLEVTLAGRSDVIVPYPDPKNFHTRHMADVRIDANGNIWASAAYDPGDHGPFVSAIYILGSLRLADDRTHRFEPNPALTRLRSFSRKVEAFEFVPGPNGGIALGTDDESEGGWVCFD